MLGIAKIECEIAGRSFGGVARHHPAHRGRGKPHYRQIRDRHRAMGDAEATVILFEKLMRLDGDDSVFDSFLKLLKS